MSKLGKLETGDTEGDGEYLLMAMMDIPPEHEAEFNRVYAEEHFRNVAKVPGVKSAARFRLESTTRKGITPKYLAIYVLDSPKIVDTPEWEAASAQGVWRTTIRPLTINRESHCWRVMKVQ